MHSQDFDEFARLLDETYDLIGSGANKVISGGAKSLFFKALAKYPLDAVRKALVAHCLDKERGRFTPKPADIVEQIEGAGNDGRPGAEEAWAIALTGRDEADTVVWTQETAEAFALAGPVLEMGDEVGARMAFKEAYQRLVAAARNRGVPAQWLASLGWDVERRTAALTKASNAGLLAAPVVAGLLPPPAAGALDNDPNARNQLDKIRQMMATMNAEKSREAELHAQRERDATAEAKRLANEKVALYQVGKAA